VPLPLGEFALADLVKHPKLFILYAALIGIGWLTNRLLPDDCHRDGERWRALYILEERRRDSVQATKDLLYEALLKQNAEDEKRKAENKVTDSLLSKLGNKADSIFKKQKP
jgi:hypothetical protein